MPAKNRKATRMTPGFTGPFKGAPQQGTLFDKRALDQLPGNVEQTEQRVGPRGYSPARLREVRAAFNPEISMEKLEHDPEQGWTDKQVYSFRGGRDSEGNDTLAYGVPAHTSDHYLYGVTPIRFDDHLRRGKPHSGEGPWAAIDRSMGRAKSKMLETVARSTAPASDLEGLTHIKVKQRPTEGRHSHAGGYYEHKLGRGQQASQVTPILGDEPGLGDPATLPREEKAGHITLSPGADEWQEPGHSELTLLHELGHHASYMRGTQHSKYNTSERQAEEEAYADKYSMRHFRQRADRTGREAVKRNWPEGAQKSVDPRSHSYGARGNYGDSGWSVNQPEYQLEPHMVMPEHLRSGYNEHHYEVNHEVERQQRPMLDEGLGGEVFKPEHFGITRPRVPERALSGEPPNREDIYGHKAWDTQKGLEGEHKQAARQWEVRRNVHPAMISRQLSG